MDAAQMKTEQKTDAKKKYEKIIEVKNVTKVFDDGVTVIDNLNLSIRKGQFVTLLGPSGCGKTTLLRIIAGFENATEGTIYIDGVDMTGIPPYKRPVNTVFQRYALFPHLNVFKNIAFGLKIKDKRENKKTVKEFFANIKNLAQEKKERKEKIKNKVTEALKLVGLSGYERRNVTSLSGGQQQRVAIARALVLEPSVLLLDEPLGALDLKMRKEMQRELISMHKELGITFIYVTHDQEEALTMSDVIVVMNDGVIQQIGTPKNIYDEPSNAFVADFIGESNLISGTMVKDYVVGFLNHELQCMDKGFDKNEKVDIVIRPEDIAVYRADDKDNSEKQFDGKVISSVFQGTYYEMEIEAEGYEFTVQSTENYNPGEEVGLGIKPDGIHIMKKMRSVNEFTGEVLSDNTLWFCEGEFEFVNDGEFKKGDNVKISIGFDAVTLTDDEEDGVIGANVTQSIYKGNYYQVQIYTDTDEDFYIDTVDEWDINDRVGVNIDKSKIKVEKIKEDKDEKTAEN